MHPNPSSGNEVLIRMGKSSHADVNVIPDHTDVNVKTAGGFRARGRLRAAAASEDR